MEEVPPSTESTADLPRSQDGDMPFTSGEREGSFIGDGAIPPEYGPTPSVSSIPPSITPSASSDVHPFKLERYVDNKGNTRTRVYLGRLRYLINNFDVVIQSDTRSTTSYSGSMGTGSSEITGPESGHTHSGTSTVTIPDHEHKNGSTESHGGLTIPEHKHVARDSTEDGLLMPNHEHEAGTDSDNLKIPQHQHEIGISGDTAYTNAGGYNHYHDIYINQQTNNIVSSNNLSVTGKTDEVKDYDSSSSNVVKKVTGKTGGIFEKNDNDNVEGRTGGIYGSLSPISVTTGSSTGHTHPLPVLSNNAVTVDSFICVKNQSQGAGFINEIEPDGFTAIKDSNDKDTVLKAKDMPINQTYGSFFLKWSIILPTGSASGATIAANSITIHRESDPTKTAEQLQNDFGAMSALTANSETAAMGSFKRGSHSEADRTATYYVKLGVSYDPNAAGTNSKSIEQITYENVYWCPLFISSIPS